MILILLILQYHFFYPQFMDPNKHDVLLKVAKCFFFLHFFAFLVFSCSFSSWSTCSPRTAVSAELRCVYNTPGCYSTGNEHRLQSAISLPTARLIKPSPELLSSRNQPSLGWESSCQPRAVSRHVYSLHARHNSRTPDPAHCYVLLHPDCGSYVLREQRARV